MSKSPPSSKKHGRTQRTVVRNSKSGRFVGLIDEADAAEFRSANTAVLKEMGSSKKRAIEILKGSGYLTRSGEVSKRYR